MTKHLSDDELVDLAERGVSHPHLAQCERCGQQVSELGALLRAAGEAAVPEPSPLFWEHFAARVEAEIASARQDGGRPWRAWPAAVTWRRAALAAALLVAMAGAVWRPRVPSQEERTSAPRAELGAFLAPSDAEPGTAGDDETWALLTDAVAAFELDVAAEAGFEFQPGAAEVAATQLSPDEQRELVRLLQAALAEPEL